MQKLVILGGGFAGVWAALAAVATLRAHSAATDIAVTLVSRDPWLTIRPRLYEASLDDVRVSLDAVLEPAGVARVEGEVTGIDSFARTIELESADGARLIRYDRLILAAGSHVHRPTVPGIEHAFSVDTYRAALELERHLATLPALPRGDGRFGAVVVGAGFTGIEVATTLVERLRALAAVAGERARVVLVGAAPDVAPDLSADGRRHVERALGELGIESRVSTSVSSLRPEGAIVSGGELIPASTTVWTGGLRASPLAAQLPVDRDASGRIPVDAFLRVRGVDGVYAAGDVAQAMADATHIAPMSCQHAIPMGERAGANAVAELLGISATRYAQPNHVTCLDLGKAGALFLEGWTGEVRLSGFWAKLMKETINTRLIYPPAAPAARSAA
jgi:NADH:ubiquinone reductase (H+-translocating)